MRFSERIGVKQARVEIQIGSIDDALRNSLWSAVLASALSDVVSTYRTYAIKERQILGFTNRMFVDFFKWPTDKVPRVAGDCTALLRKWFFDASWAEVYDFLEASLESLRALDDSTTANYLIQLSNQFLEKELSAYRFVGHQIATITNETEISAINNAIMPKPQFASVTEHISTAINLYSNRSNPDYRNSIKESISAVEAAARVISGNEKATLGQALNLIDKGHPIHPALKEGLSKIYGFTSDEGGIRHSLTDETTSVDQTDAYFMLVSCSAFCNYLIERYDKLP